MRRLLTILGVMALLAGCGAGDPNDTPVTVGVSELVTALPTPRGFIQSTDVESADAAAIQRIFAQGTVDAEAARNYESIGFEEAAVRTWRGDDDATLTVVASRWGNHQTAANVGGGAAEQIPLSQGARAWTPTSLGGARGTIAAADAPAVITLSMAVSDVDVFIIATGLRDTTPVVRTMDLARLALGAS